MTLSELGQKLKNEHWYHDDQIDAAINSLKDACGDVDISIDTNNPIRFLMDQITNSVNNAVSVLDQQNLMIASGTFASHLGLKLPFDSVTANADLTIVVGPNPYKVNQ